MDLDLSKFSWEYLSKPLFHVGTHHISFLSIVVCLLIVFSFFTASRWIERIVGRALSRTSVESGVGHSLSRLSRYAMMGIGLVVALDAVGISLSSLATVGAVFMVGIGFGLQNVTQNFISGLIILIERPIKAGDLVQVQGVTGKVVGIGLRSTIVETRDEVSVIVPNAQFISEQVVNESHSSEKMRLCVEVGAAYGTDPNLVERALLEAARDHPKILSSPLPQVQFSSFGASSLDFKLFIWTRDIWGGDFILSDLRFAIEAKFREHSVIIPFPQRDLHIKTGSLPS
ncbi:MAG: mechanosensitive ion channel [Bacteriovoracales bacterium]|nr:mechanosensitive ion channel [Bacteriovoracales bacterium]